MQILLLQQYRKRNITNQCRLLNNFFHARLNESFGLAFGQAKNAKKRRRKVLLPFFTPSLFLRLCVIYSKVSDING